MHWVAGLKCSDVEARATFLHSKLTSYVKCSCTASALGVNSPLLSHTVSCWQVLLLVFQGKWKRLKFKYWKKPQSWNIWEVAVLLLSMDSADVKEWWANALTFWSGRWQGVRQVLFENTCDEGTGIAPISLLLFCISWVMNGTAYKYLSSFCHIPTFSTCLWGSSLLYKEGP